jgi:hypothetical protein
MIVEGSKVDFLLIGNASCRRPFVWTLDFWCRRPFVWTPDFWACGRSCWWAGPTAHREVSALLYLFIGNFLGNLLVIFLVERPSATMPAQMTPSYPLVTAVFDKKKHRA